MFWWGVYFKILKQIQQTRVWNPVFICSWGLRGTPRTYSFGGSSHRHALALTVSRQSGPWGLIAASHLDLYHPKWSLPIYQYIYINYMSMAQTRVPGRRLKNKTVCKIKSRPKLPCFFLIQTPKKDTKTLQLLRSFLKSGFWSCMANDGCRSSIALY